MTNPPYLLGHSEFEFERLARQERLVGSATRAYFESAGIAPGMRVLDVGSGTGVVAFHAADLVGPSGQVIGSDLSPAAVAAASAAAKARSLPQVSFRLGNPTEMIFEQPFDAIVGRYVLMFQADAGDMLRRLVKLLRPGGIVAFHEPDWSFARSDPVAPTYDCCIRWIVETFKRAGTTTNMGAKLHRTFLDAGLPSPTMRMRALIGDATSAREFLQSMAELAIVLTSAMENEGVATRTEIAGDTLFDRMVREVAANRSVVVGRAEIGAWVRL